ncbi:MAG: tetratricopeptide repeat protein [Cyanobacteria bacterium HKST-UBA02]|nr:tetratricopeptide repeat protein [Cyanobacteria bacterium HKST-UBA02]
MAEATANQSGSGQAPTNPSSWGGLVQKVERLISEGRHDQAENIALEALALAEDYPPDDRRTGITLELLCEIYFSTRQYTYAAPVMMRVLQMYRRCLGFNHIDTGTITHNAARLYHEWRKFDEAKAFYELAQRIKSGHLGAEHTDVMAIKQQYNQLLYDMRAPRIQIKRAGGGGDRMKKTGQWDALPKDALK